MSGRTFLITGGCGFFGSHLVKKILEETSDDLVIIDSLTYAGSLDNLRSVSTALLNSPRVRFFSWDIRKEAGPNLVKELLDVTHIVHLAAETHVDSSVIDPLKFVVTNVIGTTNVLELARQLPNLELFHQGSTDETSGSAPLDPSFTGFKERERYLPSNPYSASKAAAEMMVIAYANSFKVPCIITNLMNLFSSRQHPEKYIPKTIKYIMTGEKLTIHSLPDKINAGMRTYIEASAAADAFMFLYREQPWLKFPITHVESYNICGSQEVDNLSLAKSIEKLVQMRNPEASLRYELVDFHSARPHHDARYRLDGSKMTGLGWNPPQTFHESLKDVVSWYLDNPQWLGLPS